MEFTEADMKTLCTTIRCPGGMIINPRANIADQPPTIRDTSHLILMISEKHLLVTAYVEMHQARTSIPIDLQSMTRSFIVSLSPLREQELAYRKPRAIDNPLRDTYMSKWIESLDDYLLKCRGANKCPLVYLARSQVAFKPHVMYPATDYENVDQ